MGYMQEVDHWVEGLINELFEEPERAPLIKRAIREKLLESYRNGMKAAGKPVAAPRNSERPRTPPRGRYQR